MCSATYDKQTFEEVQYIHVYYIYTCTVYMYSSVSDISDFFFLLFINC